MTRHRRADVIGALYDQPVSPSQRLSSIIWQRSDRLFSEIGQLDRTGAGYLLAGRALYRGRSGPSSFSYRIETDRRWLTSRAEFVLDEPTLTQRRVLESDGNGGWRLDGEPLALDFGCQDIDLAISPSTNTLAIRRLDLPVGSSATARVLWIQIPSFKTRAVEQTYQRVAVDRYRYKGKYGSYQLQVDPNGVVLDYPGGGWTSAAHRVSQRG